MTKNLGKIFLTEINKCEELKKKIMKVMEKSLDKYLKREEMFLS